MSLWPGLRLSNSFCIRFISTFNLGGHPSRITPTAPPCDYPKVLTRKIFPKLLLIEISNVLSIYKHYMKPIEN